MPRHRPLRIEKLRQGRFQAREPRFYRVQAGFERIGFLDQRLGREAGALRGNPTAAGHFIPRFAEKFREGRKLSRRRLLLILEDRTERVRRNPRRRGERRPIQSTGRKARIEPGRIKEKRHRFRRLWLGFPRRVNLARRLHPKLA